MKKIQKIKEIKSFFEIEEISENYIQLKDRIVLIYKIEPFNINLESSNKHNLISNVYKQFLDLYSGEFQILVLNRNLNVDNFFDIKNKENNIFFEEYKKELIHFLKNQIKKNNIVEEQYYIIINLPIGMKIKKIDEKFNIFNRNSIKCTKLNRDEIIELINMSLFKGTNE